jgi:hypothetical protein
MNLGERPVLDRRDGEGAEDVMSLINRNDLAATRLWLHIFFPRGPLCARQPKPTV